MFSETNGQKDIKKRIRLFYNTSLQIVQKIPLTAYSANSQWNNFVTNFCIHINTSFKNRQFSDVSFLGIYCNMYTKCPTLFFVRLIHSHI